MALQYDVDWESVKKEYKKLTNEHKPKEERELKAFNLSLATFERHTGLSNSLKEACAYANKKSGHDYNKFMALSTSFTKEADTYLQVLKKSLDAETTKTDKYRGLKMLQAKLDSYKKGIAAEGQKIYDAQAGRGVIEQLQNQARGGLEKAIAGFKASQKAIKATPTIAVYDREFDPSKGSAGRNLTTALQNFVAGKLPEAALAQTHIAALTPWASGGKVSLPANTVEPAGVIHELDQATAHVKACAAAFGVAW